MSARNRRFCFGCSFALLVFVTSTSAWCQSKDVAETNLSFFVVARGATEVKQNNSLGKDQIVYRIQAPYPAADVLRTITVRLEQRGWKPLKEAWLNPGLPSSHVRGWTYFEDDTTKPATSVRAWQGDWENNAHDILTYILEYRCPENLCSSTFDLHDLRVIAIHIPSDLAEQIKSSIPSNRTAR
jgi:hypothetical protein